MNTTNPRSVRGKAFVLPFAAVVLFLLWLVFSMAVRFQTLMQRLEQTRAEWPATSALFLARYEELDQQLEDLPAASVQSLVPLVTTFRKRTQFDMQVGVVKEIEKILEVSPEWTDKREGLMKRDEVRQVVESESVRKDLQSDFIGKCTLVGLQLDLPPIFELESN